MSSFCPKYIAVFLVLIFSFAFLAEPVFADRTVDSVTLNGSSSVTVVSSASITASVNVTISAANNWQSTSWQISGQSVNCVDHTDYTSSGTFTENFSITAPGSIGVYDVSFIAYGNNACSSGASNTYTLTNGITVAAPTATPTPTSSSSPTSTPVPGAPTPTPTSAASSSSSSSSSSVTYYPSVALVAFSPNPTNKASLTFSGTASIEQGTITLVEYTLDEGASWMQAQAVDGNFNGKDEHFTFTTSNLPEGKHTVKVRAKSGSGAYTKIESYASDTVTIATTPPKVTLDKISPNPTKNQTPTITGKATAKLADISKTEISIDNGKSWQVTKRSGNIFTITLSKLEDNNYPVIARAFDAAGNVGQSDTQTLIIDTIPPIIGGSMQSLGPQILIPDKNDIVSIASGVDTIIAMSMKGGVIEAQIQTTDGIFKLLPQPGTNMWVGKVRFEKEGEKLITISAVDGANNKTERPFNTILVEQFGTIEEKSTQQAIKNAEISLYYFETVAQQWILWEGKSYGQENPQKTDDKGSYSFMVPAGKYYIGVTAPGYHTTQSQILTLSETSMLNFAIPLRSKPKLTFSLPFIGDVTLTIPTFTPPDTIQTIVTSPQLVSDKTTLLTLGSTAPNFSLPNLENKDINLASFKGKRLLLSFIAPWSSLSLEQAPFLSEVSSSISENQAVLVVSLQESVASTQALMKKGNYRFPVVADKDGETAAVYKITLLPHHVFIDEAGRIQETYVGVLSKRELIEKLMKLQ